MKLLVVFACIIAVSLAAPVAKPDDDDDNLAVESDRVVTSIVGGPVVDTQIVSGTPVFQQNAVAYSVPVAFSSGAQVYTGAVPYTVGAPGIYKAQKIDGDDDDDDDVDAKFVKTGIYASGYAPAGVNVAVAPAVTTYSAGQAVVSPGITSYKYGQTVAAPSVASYGVTNAVATPAVTSYAVAAPAIATPVQYKAAAAVVPAVAAVQREAIVQEVKPVSVAVPSAITYEAAHTVQLPPKEINVPVQHQTVEIPVEQRVVYGTENYVAGTSTQVYKPQITAPAITAPRVFVAKARQAAPEVTVYQSEVTVEQKSPNYVAAPFDAGIIVEKAAPHINQIDVPTPVEVPQAVNVPTPYAVPVAQPVKVKSSVKPVVNVDLHTVQTENVVTPIEYTAHHHVATAPVVATPAVAVQAAPAVGIAANVPTAVTYGASAPAAVAVQGVATEGVFAQGVVPYGVASQGVVTGGRAVSYSATPVAQNVIYGSSPAIVQGGYAGVPTLTFTGEKINQGNVKFVTVGETSAQTVPQVTTYSAPNQGVVQQVVSGGTITKGTSGSKVYFDTSVNLDD